MGKAIAIMYEIDIYNHVFLSHYQFILVSMK